MGKVEIIGPHYVEVKEGLIGKKSYFIPKYYFESFDGEKLHVSLSEDEIKRKWKRYQLSTITPAKDGKLTVVLPRDLIDYKVAGGKDGKFQVNINAKPISTYQEIPSNRTTRGLEIDFTKNDRAIEVVGTQMGLADIAEVKKEATEATPQNSTQNATNNTSHIEPSITNKTIEGAETFVNKSASVLGNLSGEVGELLK
jgi:hypothetical protein